MDLKSPKHLQMNTFFPFYSSTTKWKTVFPIGLVTTLYLISWQFAQFTLFTQVSVIFGLFNLGLIPQLESVIKVLQGLLVSSESLEHSRRIKWWIGNSRCSLISSPASSTFALTYYFILMIHFVVCCQAFIFETLLIVVCVYIQK